MRIVTGRLTRLLLTLMLITTALVLPQSARLTQAAITSTGTYFVLVGNSIAAITEAAPTSLSTPVPVTGLTANETLVGIDVRPQNGRLYGLGVDATANTATLYLLNPQTGFAAVVGSASQIAFTTDGATPVDLPDPAVVGYDFEFNPAVDRIRVVAGSLNFRANPNTGAPVDGGGATGTNPDGPINGDTTTIDGAAYTNNVINTSVTTLYTLDATSNALNIQNPPNNGTQDQVQPITLGGNTLDFTGINGFDIPLGVNAAANNAPVIAGFGVAAFNVGGTTGLYSINLVNGQATFIGQIGGGFSGIQDLAIWSPQPVGNALSQDGANILRFSLDAPGTPTTQALNLVSVNAAGETLVGIDGRPQTGQLYGLGVNATADAATLYLIDPQTGAVTPIGTPGQIAFVDGAGNPVDFPDPLTAGYGIDFNPTVDRVRVVTSTGLNFRTNPVSGAAVDGNLGGAVVSGTNPDGSINGLPGGSTGVSATAYTNNYNRDLGVVGPITQYTLDAASNSLFIQNPPNAGTQTSQLAITLNGSPLDFTDVNAFDIALGVSVNTSNTAATGNGYAALTVGGSAGLYRINLATGAATLVGTVGTGAPSISGLVAWSDTPAATLTATTTTVSEGVGSVDLTITSTGGAPLIVGYQTGGGSATAGSDYTATSGTLVLGLTSSSQTISLPITNDTIVEENETIEIRLLGANSVQQTLTLTITDDEPRVSLSAANYTASELGGTAVLTATLSAASATPVTVQYATSDGTAIAGSDYITTTGTLTFEPGETSKTISVPILGDEVTEPEETFTVTLSAPTGGGLGTQSNATVTISDGEPRISFSTASYFGDEVSGTAVLTVTLSQASTEHVMVQYATSDGTATAGSDYTTTSGILMFEAGETSKTISVPILSDLVAEPEENLTVTLSTPTNAGLSAPVSATVTITDRPVFKVYIPLIVAPEVSTQP